MFQSTSASKKRRYDDDDDSELDDWPLDKKQRTGSHFAFTQTLSIRSSELPPPPAIVFSSALTPAHSESGDSAGSPPPSAPWMAFSIEDDIDMDDSDIPVASSPPLHSPIPPFCRPSRLDPQSFQQALPGGRMPTPIFNTFGAHMFRPRNDSMFAIAECEKSETTAFPDVSHRMPSPISEDDADFPTMQTESQLSRLTVDDMDGVADDAMSISPRRGRARSGAITGKKRFSMGYRDDCEKCRMRTPGHYAHFLPS